MQTGRGTHSGVFSGIVLMLLGVLFLLSNFGLLPHFAGGLVVAGVFAAVGVAFLVGFAANPRSWGLLIPAFTLMGLAGLIALGSVAPDLAEAWGGSLFLASVGLGFLAIFPFQRGQWWPIIPAGSTFTLAAVAALGTHGWYGDRVAAVLFFGLAATFFLVFLVGEAAGWGGGGADAGRPPVARTRWALIPAGTMAVMGFIGVIGFGRFFGVFWPVLLIVAGLAVLLGRRR